MKIKLLPVALFSILSVANVNAQQIFRLSQYTQHNYLFNPAAAGANEKASIGVTYKKMWEGIDGGPQTTILYGDKYFAKQKVGVAAFLYDDKTGPTSRTGGEVDLSYSVKLDATDKRLMLGLGGQFIQYKIDKAQMLKYIPGDPLLNGPGTVTTGDASAGVYYNSSTLNLGFSVKQLIQSKLDFIKTKTNTEGRLYRHFYAMGSYNIRTDEDIVLVPNMMVKFAANAPVDIEGGMRLEYQDLLWVGFNYHYEQSYSAFAGLKIDHKLAIGYAYDQYKTPLSFFDNGGDAHEISIRYFFGK